MSEPSRSLDQLLAEEQRLLTFDPDYESPHPIAAPLISKTVPAARAAEMPFLGLYEILDALEREETGDAELLARLYAGRIVFDHREKQWYLWNGLHWETDATGFIIRLISDQVAAQYLEAATNLNKLGADKEKEMIEALIKRARSLRRKYRIHNVLDLARPEPLGIKGTEWDGDPWLLGCANGTINLANGTLQPGAPEDYVRTVCPTKWRGLDAAAPRWELFLREIFTIDGEPEHELIEFLQRLLGYGITGLCTEHVLPVLWGFGRNGKDTLLAALQHVIGPYADPIARSLLLESGKETRRPTPDRIDLARKRIVWASESKEGERLNSGQVKLITGGGRIPARQMYKSDIERLLPQHLPMLVTNHKPHAPADDYALWKRLLLIPFEQSFVDDPDPQKPYEHKRDPYLLDKLKAEASGILAWLVAGCLEWQQNGLQPSVSVQVATEEYRQEEDVIGRFLEEKCIKGAAHKTKASFLYKAYKEWCGEYGIRRPMSLTAFGKRMTKRFQKNSTRTGIIYYGVGLLSDDEEKA